MLKRIVKMIKEFGQVGTKLHFANFFSYPFESVALHDLPVSVITNDFLINVHIRTFIIF